MGSINRTKKARWYLAFLLVEARGIEPLSENLSTGPSTSVVDDLKFPPRSPHQQGRRFGSFINPACGKAYAGWFPTLMTPVSAVVGNGGRTVTAIYAATGTVFFASYYLSRFLRSTGLRLAYPASMIPVETMYAPKQIILYHKLCAFKSPLADMEHNAYFHLKPPSGQITQGLQQSRFTPDF